MEVRMSRTVLRHGGNAALASTALELRVGDRSLVLPSHGATFADHMHARRAGIRLDAPLLNYYHTDYTRPLTQRATQDNISRRIGLAQEWLRPLLTMLHVGHRGSLDGGGLAALHGLQRRLGLPVITTVEKDPLQDVEAFREEMEEFEAFETDQARAPTISVRCDPDNFEAKLRHIARRHRIVNVQWGGYGEHLATWETLSVTLREVDVWCNVIEIPRRYETVGGRGGQKIRPSLIVPAIFYGAHSYCVMPQSFPRGAGGGAGRGARGEGDMRFDPPTWCYRPALARRGAPRAGAARPQDTAHARSFNGVQEALGLVRGSILDGSFYSRRCPESLGLRVSLERALERSAASRDPGQAGILDN